MTRHAPIKVVDLFAGPGGLAEGFASLNSHEKRIFDVTLSIEKDATACRTLQLRKFFRAFDTPPESYWEHMAGAITVDQLYSRHRHEASIAAAGTWNAALGGSTDQEVSRRIRAALGDTDEPWVLVGGPPCQAYSLAGRSRMRSTNPLFEQDERHLLYREYLKIVARHRPTVFVMENVKGLLSSTHDGRGIFGRILEDLRQPSVAAGLSSPRALAYRLYGLGAGEPVEFTAGRGHVRDFLVRAETLGVPQARHRVFVVGVRADIDVRPLALQPLFDDEVPASGVLDDLPALRSKLSRSPDSPLNWRRALNEISSHSWMEASRDNSLGKVSARVRRALRSLEDDIPTGTSYVAHRRSTVARRALSEWYRADAVGLTLHEARSHMKEDLHRYLFASCYAEIHDRSPDLRDFPAELRPRHANLEDALEGSMFGDRFRVQLPWRPSSTVTSHISKDGHYFIHYSPEQCRSLTVREAARLQTFPDSYFFCGNRTQQYHQVGNAVPPLLARTVAESVYGLLRAIRGTAR